MLLLTFLSCSVTNNSEKKTLDKTINDEGGYFKKKNIQYHPSIAMRLISKFLKNIMKAMSFMECQYHISYSQFRVL